MQKIDSLRQNDMMRHLLDALDQRQDIGHYGRLVFAMVARHFMDDEELVSRLARNPNFSELQAKALVQQVQSRDYNPPRREKIAQWQREQEFPICPGGDDPDACNLYRNLEFPADVYEKIGEYHEEKVLAQEEDRGGR
ncbi:MAG: hypothetical protein JWN40_5286 [Phycisphaerales bacterium]|nr:hypothetical protein [Phycisphaerales bacterium]